MRTVAAEELNVGDETCEPASGCVCTITGVSLSATCCFFTVNGIPGTVGIIVLRERQMALRKKNDPFEC